MPMEKQWRLWSNAPSCCLSGVWWTQRTSWATSSQSRCLQKCETGWPPPSPARWAWCCDATRRNPASAASCTLSRLEYLWRGKFVSGSVRVRCTEPVLCVSDSLTWEKTYWSLPQSVLQPGATQSIILNVLCFRSSILSAGCPSCFLALTLMLLAVLVRNLLQSNLPSIFFPSNRVVKQDYCGKNDNYVIITFLKDILG